MHSNHYLLLGMHYNDLCRALCQESLSLTDSIIVFTLGVRGLNKPKHKVHVNYPWVNDTLSQKTHLGSPGSHAPY